MRNRNVGGLGSIILAGCQATGMIGLKSSVDMRYVGGNEQKLIWEKPEEYNPAEALGISDFGYMGYVRENLIDINKGIKKLEDRFEYWRNFDDMDKMSNQDAEIFNQMRVRRLHAAAKIKVLEEGIEDSLNWNDIENAIHLKVKCVKERKVFNSCTKGMRKIADKYLDNEVMEENHNDLSALYTERKNWESELKRVKSKLKLKD
jgi:hypothetical protein